MCAGALEGLVGHARGETMKPERQQYKGLCEEFQGNPEWDFWACQEGSGVSSSGEQSFLTVYAMEEKWDVLWPL